MFQVCFGFVTRRNCKPECPIAPAQTSNFWENKPHPSDFVFCPLAGPGIYLRRSAIRHLQSVAGGMGRSRLSPYHQRPVPLGEKIGACFKVNGSSIRAAGGLIKRFLIYLSGKRRSDFPH